MTPSAPSFAHLRRLTDAGGLYEHAELTTPRREHGYCVDDVARALVVVSREQTFAGTDARSEELTDLHEQYLTFLLDAQVPDGRFRNRRSADLVWSNEPSVEDCWGRALWGLGAAVAAGGWPGTDERALTAFELGAGPRSPWTRAMAFAALGAADVLSVLPGHRAARELLVAAAGLIGRSRPDVGWPWPEDRLTYANAALPDALLAAGHLLGSSSMVADGLLLLGWLLDAQTRDGHLSVAPVSGRGPGEHGPSFDQQPIEVAHLADACARAHAITDDRRWVGGIELCTAWFLGDNDSATPLLDDASGGGCDGLEATGRNENEGAESTLALISTLQQSRRVSLCVQ